MSFMDYKKKTKTGKVLAGILTVAVCFCFAAAGVYAEGKTDDVEDLTADGYENKSFTYCQRAFYQEPYIIELGWNLSEKMVGDEEFASYRERSVVLPDENSMTVYFREGLEEEMADDAVLTAVAGAIGSAEKCVEEGKLGAQTINLAPLQKPYVVTVLYLPLDEMDDFVQKAWKNDDAGQISYVTDALTDEVKMEYCQRAYAENRMDFFVILCDELPQEEIDALGRQCYEEDRLDYFAVICKSLSEEAKAELRKKAGRDGKGDYYYIVEDSDEW
ncbi:MAG: hypothetical protein NC434_02620 [Ruminococcus sp.]|nr:hypothetical protein [Ruminococcus sp.]